MEGDGSYDGQIDEIAYDQSSGGEGIASESRDSHALPKDSLIGSAAPSPPEGQIGTEAYFYKLRRVDYGVPCDDAAIERAATLLLEHHLFAKRPALAHHFATRVLRAAGETP